jgi:hypothetical protein
MAGTLLALAVLAVPVQAATLEIQITGLDFVYDGNNIFDAGVQNTTRSGDPADGNALLSMEFLVDGALVGTLDSDIWADIYLADIGPISDTGPTFVVSSGNGNAFGVDLLTTNAVPGWGLALNVDEVQFLYSGNEIAISVSGLATGIFDQSLPFGLAFDEFQNVTFVLSSANLTVATGGGLVTSIAASGTGNAKGILVPEPSSLVLMGLACIATAWFGVRSRKRR